MEKIMEALEEQLASGRLIIGIGPMSPNCVEAAFSYSHKQKCIIELIASRRQVECSTLGNGYVNNWTTEAFAAHIGEMRKKYPASKILVCRDHGGPWQGNDEQGVPFGKAMERAKASYRADISSGFDLVHIDPSLNMDGKGSEGRTLSAAFELLSFCSQAAERQGRKMHFEIGTEENVGKAVSIESFDSTLGKISDYCKESGIELPLFVVGQTGSLVKEMRQVGNFDSESAGQLAACARKHGALLKEHNADYISEHQISKRFSSGVPAMNVAPEFGAIESRLFVQRCAEKGRGGRVEKVLALSLASGKWKKWLDSAHVSDYDKAMISGHYVFASKEFQSLLGQVGKAEFDKSAVELLSERIDFYCRARN